MASPSPEASEIRRRGRQRLIGAVAIALLLIVFVPMLLDSEPRPAREAPKLDIPPKDKAPPLPAPTADPKAAAAPPPSASSAEYPMAAPPVVDEPPKPAPKVATVVPKAEPAKAAPAKHEGFAVQVGAFADEAKLKQVRDKLTAAKIATYTEPAGNLTRLRVGPFPTREAAEKSAAVVRKTVSDAKVVPLP